MSRKERPIDRALVRAVGWLLSLVSWLQRRINWQPLERTLARLRRDLMVRYVARLDDAGLSPYRSLPRPRRRRPSARPVRSVAESSAG
jgi:hypothetical protein